MIKQILSAGESEILLRPSSTSARPKQFLAFDSQFTGKDESFSLYAYRFDLLRS